MLRISGESAFLFVVAQTTLHRLCPVARLYPVESVAQGWELFLKPPMWLSFDNERLGNAGPDHFIYYFFYFA